MLTNGSNPDIKNRAGDSPLMIALREKTGIMGVRTLLAHGADPNTVDAQGTPALVQSILDYYGHTRDRTAPIPVIEILIKAGADPNASTPEGATALHHQLDTAGGSGPIAQTLIALGANPNAQDQRGNTPLHWYVRQPGRGSSLLATLIDNGADPCIQNHNGNTPLDVSADHDYEDQLPECSSPGNAVLDATAASAEEQAQPQPETMTAEGGRLYGAIAYATQESSGGCQGDKDCSVFRTATAVWDDTAEKAGELALHLCETRGGVMCEVAVRAAPWASLWVRRWDGRVRIHWFQTYQEGDLHRSWEKVETLVHEGWDIAGLNRNLVAPGYTSLAGAAESPPKCNHKLLQLVQSEQAVWLSPNETDYKDDRYVRARNSYRRCVGGQSLCEIDEYRSYRGDSEKCERLETEFWNGIIGGQ